MASVTLQVGANYAVSTSVKAYPASNWTTAALPPSGSPVGSEAATASVGSDGALTFTGLTEDTDYYAYASSGHPAYIRFRVDNVLAGTGTLVSVDGAPVNEIDIDPDLLDLAEGELIVGGVSGPETFALGDEGQILRVAGSSLAWDDEAAGGVSEMGTYRPLFRAAARITTSGASGSKYWFNSGAADVVTASPNTASTANMVIVPLGATDYAVTGQDTKLRIKSLAAFSSTNPAVTVTVGLYPITAGVSMTLGTVIAGSTAVHTINTTSAIDLATGSDFAFPADDNYALGYILSGTPIASVMLYSVVQIRNV